MWACCIVSCTDSYCIASAMGNLPFLGTNRSAFIKNKKNHTLNLPSYTVTANQVDHAIGQSHDGF